jgi:PAS domain S-box-containing protein
MDLETPLAIQLQATLGRIELVLGAIDEAIVWTDEYGSIRWSNRTFDRLVNRSRFEILGARLLDLLPLAQDNQILTSAAHPLSLALASQLNTTEIYQFQQEDRTLILEISATYLELPARERSITLVIRNITERKQAEMALRESQKMLQLVIDNVPQSIFWKDRDFVFQGWKNRSRLVLQARRGGLLPRMRSPCHAAGYPRIPYHRTLAASRWNPSLARYQ